MKAFEVGEAPSSPWHDTNVCSIVIGVGLTWKPRGASTSAFDGHDDTGRHCGYVTNITGRWTFYLTPWACSREGGLATGPFEDAAEAMAAADRSAAGHLDGLDGS